jgi:hypothetical protein
VGQPSLVSLGFLDETLLLFTFNESKLIHREFGVNGEIDERQIHAIVLELPAGTVKAVAQWTVHDLARYLWVLKDSHFLLRDQDSLLQGDARLRLKPVMRFPGPLLWLALDPTQQFLVANSREPLTAANKPSELSSPATTAASSAVNDQEQSGQPNLVVRILRRDTGQVLLASHLASAPRTAINFEGYLEIHHDRSQQWLLNLDYFGGGSRPVGSVNSACPPTAEFVSDDEILITTCMNVRAHKLVAMDTGGRVLWTRLTSDMESRTAFGTPLAIAQNGLRLARETLPPFGHGAPAPRRNPEYPPGQLVRIFDAANGKVVLEAPASPEFVGGGNVAISPSGRRVAVLNAGAIQVFDLPAAPPLPETAGRPAGH